MTTAFSLLVVYVVLFAVQAGARQECVESAEKFRTDRPGWLAAVVVCRVVMIVLWPAAFFYFGKSFA